jgi:hypothetical protein
MKLVVGEDTLGTSLFGDLLALLGRAGDQRRHVTELTFLNAGEGLLVGEPAETDDRELHCSSG